MLDCTIITDPNRRLFPGFISLKSLAPQDSLCLSFRLYLTPFLSVLRDLNLLAGSRSVSTCLGPDPDLDPGLKGTVQRKLSWGKKWYQWTAYDLPIRSLVFFLNLKSLGPLNLKSLGPLNLKKRFSAT
jgi:hypothetical protein